MQRGEACGGVSVFTTNNKEGALYEMLQGGEVLQWGGAKSKSSSEPEAFFMGVMVAG